MGRIQVRVRLESGSGVDHPRPRHRRCPDPLTSAAVRFPSVTSPVVPLVPDVDPDPAESLIATSTNRRKERTLYTLFELDRTFHSGYATRSMASCRTWAHSARADGEGPDWLTTTPCSPKNMRQNTRYSVRLAMRRGVRGAFAWGRPTRSTNFTGCWSIRRVGTSSASTARLLRATSWRFSARTRYVFSHGATAISPPG